MSSSSIAQQQVVDPSTTKALGTLDEYSAFELTSWASSPTIPDSGFACEDFRVGAGMLIIQPSTGKVVLCYDTKRKKYFLPKGRKDIGESLAQAAVREACEESGYQVQHYPTHKIHQQPPPPYKENLSLEPDIEPFYVSTRRMPKTNGQYFTFWYLGCVADDAKWTRGTGMTDEQSYTADLYDEDKALDLVKDPRIAEIVEYGYAVWEAHCTTVAELDEK